MLLANLDVRAGLVNGSRGVVTGFVEAKEAVEEISHQAVMRGMKEGDESGEVGILQRFMRGNDNMRFPRVLFETKNQTKEVRPKSINLVDGPRLLLHLTNGRYNWDSGLKCRGCRFH